MAPTDQAAILHLRVSQAEVADMDPRRGVTDLPEAATVHHAAGMDLEVGPEAVPEAVPEVALGVARHLPVGGEVVEDTVRLRLE